MAKRLAVFVTLLGILAFIAGCEPEAIEGPQVEPQEAETTKIESPETKPPDPEAPKVEAPEVESPEPNLPTIETLIGEPPKTEPNEIKPTKVEPNEVEPNEIEPTKVEPNEVGPIKAEPNKVKLSPKVTFHDKCADILGTYVDDKGLVDYKTLDRKSLKLKALLREFAKLDPKEYERWSKEDKIALWINAYNLQMLNVITKNYPIESSRILRLFWPPDSIRHIKGIWTDYKFMVMGEQFWLREVEQRFFRKQFDEPRLFFAICDASLSSPPLRKEPYRGEELDKQLEDQVKRFLSSPQGFRIDKKAQTVYVSAILDSSWFGREFTSKYGTNKKFKDQQPVTRAVLNFITKYVSEESVSFLEVEDYSVKYIKYDWRLNDGS